MCRSIPMQKLPYMEVSNLCTYLQLGIVSSLLSFSLMRLPIKCSYMTTNDVQQIIRNSYRLPDDALEEIRRLFAEYIGVHNFHNFTSGL